VTVPEPLGTELGGTLPIFESVESDYFRARSRGPLRPGEPRADQPTPAGQPATASAAWASEADGRRAAASGDIPAVDGLTSAGLPQRIPQASPVPDAAVDRRPGKPRRPDQQIA
jgi:hypothetical protein